MTPSVSFFVFTSFFHYVDPHPAASAIPRQVRMLHALKHENVLKFFAWYETTNHLWLILEYCVGGDLLALLRQDLRLPEPSIHDMGVDLVAALQHLHAQGLLFCDLKPSNILLDESGRLKLCDFGLARRLQDVTRAASAAGSHSGAVDAAEQALLAKRGTPCYMSPELFIEGARAGSCASSERAREGSATCGSGPHDERV